MALALFLLLLFFAEEIAFSLATIWTWLTWEQGQERINEQFTWLAIPRRWKVPKQFVKDRDRQADGSNRRTLQRQVPRIPTRDRRNGLPAHLVRDRLLAEARHRFRSLHTRAGNRGGSKSQFKRRNRSPAEQGSRQDDGRLNPLGVCRGNNHAVWI